MFTLTSWFIIYKQLNLRVADSRKAFYFKSNMLKYRVKATENVLPYKFLRTALYV